MLRIMRKTAQMRSWNADGMGSCTGGKEKREIKS